MEQKRIGIIGSGSWATAIAKIVTENGHHITWCLRQQSNIDYFEKRKHNPHYLRNAYFDLQKSLKKATRLNENVFGDVAGALGFGLGNKLFQGGKEVIAKKIIGYLGFDTNTFIGLLIVNLFANLEFKDYPIILKDCNKYTAIIVKSALEAWLDLAAQKMGGGSMEGFVYSALKNTVTETAANTTVFKKLEKLASTMVCPLIEGIKEGGLDLF